MELFHFAPKFTLPPIAAESLDEAKERAEALLERNGSPLTAEDLSLVTEQESDPLAMLADALADCEWLERSCGADTNALTDHLATASCAPSTSERYAALAAAMKALAKIYLA